MQHKGASELRNRGRGRQQRRRQLGLRWQISAMV